MKIFFWISLLSSTALAATDDLMLGAGWHNACALRKSTGMVKCWGDDFFGVPDVPVDIGFAKSISMAGDQVCVIDMTNKLSCWGENYSFFGDVPSSPPPDLGPVTAVSVAENHTCAITEAGKVHCWGYPLHDPKLTPPPDLGRATAVVAASTFSCALTAAGARCWGAIDKAGIPENLGKLDSINGSSLQVCGMKNGQMDCWGRYAGGSQSGVAYVPKDLGPIKNYTISMSFICAVTEENGVRCWENMVQTSDLENVDYLVSSMGYFMAMTAKGIVCFGDTRWGQCNIPPGI